MQIALVNQGEDSLGKNHPNQQTVNRRERQPSREAERLQELQGSKSKIRSLI